MQNRALILAAHPDDADLTMSGTIMKLIDDGWDVVIADITNGEPTPAGSVEIRAKETAMAAEALGVKERVCLDLPNRYLTDSLEYRQVVAETIREYAPRWIFSTYRPDAHPDHVHASRLVDDARFHAKLTKTDMAFEPHYAEKIIYFYASHLRVHPNPSFVLDISDYWERKVKAIECFQSQFWLNQPDARKGWIIDHLRDISRYFGNRIGVEYGEPFFCHELVGLSGLNSLL